MTSTRPCAARRVTPPSSPGSLSVSVIFFASGMSALIFQVIWFYRASLVFGSSIWATSIVLSSFMGGLALGNALVARFGHRVGGFLRAYAALELIVGLSGLALTLLLPHFARLLALFTPAIGDRLWLLNLVRFGLVSAALAVPTTAMGATLPIVLGAVRGRERFGRALGRLYGWNTLGGVVGVLAAEIVLIGHLGVTGAAIVAVTINFGCGAAALWIARGVGNGGGDSDAGAVRSPAARPGRPALRLMACAFLAGGALMGLEVLWFRFLSMFVVHSSLAVSLILAAVLAAMAAGAFAASRWLSWSRHGVDFVASVSLTAACVAVGSYEAFQSLTAGPRSVEWYRIVWFASALTFPTSALSGVLFTLLGEAFRREVAIDAPAAGWLTLSNTIGAMCGPLLATFVLLPSVGMEHALFALAGTYVAIALLMAAPLPASAGARWALAAATPAALVVLAGFPFQLMAEQYRTRSVQEYRRPGDKIVATRDGSAETIALQQSPWPPYYRLIINGFSMSATTASAVRYMRYFVYWPMLMHQEPLKRVLVICYGLGVTVGAATDLDSVDSIDVVEISPDVIAMSSAVYPAGQQPLRDPRVRLHIEDGRYYLQTTRSRFDLITGEPPPPLAPGSVNLYTREYFRLVRDRLTDGGIFTYWLPVPGAGEYDLKSIIRAFCDVFDDCSLWNATAYDWMLVGTRGTRDPVTDVAFSKWWNHPTLGRRLRAIGFETPELVGTTFLGDARYLRLLTATTPPLTDDFPQRLVPFSTRLGLVNLRGRVDPGFADFVRSVIDPERAERAFTGSEWIRRLWPGPLAGNTVPFFKYQVEVNRLLTETVARPLRHIEDLHALLTKTSLETLPLWEFGSDDRMQLLVAEERKGDGTGLYEYFLGLQAMADRRYEAAASDFAAAEQRGLEGESIRPLRVYALCLSGHLDTARLLAQGATARSADAVHFWSWLSSTFGVRSPLEGRPDQLPSQKPNS